MRMRRIPEVDLARIAVKNYDDQVRLLSRLRGFRPPHTLNPFRRAIPDIMNVQFEMLKETAETKWIKIEEKISKSKESEDGIAKNIAVAKALFDFRKERSVISFSKLTPNWSVGFGNSVSYWSQFYSVMDNRASFFFFDPRLSGKLTVAARKFVFSMMHERLRVADPDFADAALIIACFGQGDKSTRVLEIHSADSVELYSYEELNELINMTYQLWSDELASRNDQLKKTAGGSNPMGF